MNPYGYPSGLSKQPGGYPPSQNQQPSMINHGYPTGTATLPIGANPPLYAPVPSAALLYSSAPPPQSNNPSFTTLNRGMYSSGATQTSYAGNPYQLHPPISSQPVAAPPAYSSVVGGPGKSSSPAPTFSVGGILGAGSATSVPPVPSRDNRVRSMTFQPNSVQQTFSDPPPPSYLSLNTPVGTNPQTLTSSSVPPLIRRDSLLLQQQQQPLLVGTQQRERSATTSSTPVPSGMAPVSDYQLQLLHMQQLQQQQQQLQQQFLQQQQTAFPSQHLQQEQHRLQHLQQQQLLLQQQLQQQEQQRVQQQEQQRVQQQEQQRVQQQEQQRVQQQEQQRVQQQEQKRLQQQQQQQQQQQEEQRHRIQKQLQNQGAVPIMSSPAMLQRNQSAFVSRNQTLPSVISTPTISTNGTGTTSNQPPDHNIALSRALSSTSLTFMPPSSRPPSNFSSSSSLPSLAMATTNSVQVPPVAALVTPSSNVPSENYQSIIEVKLKQEQERLQKEMEEKFRLEQERLFEKLQSLTKVQEQQEKDRQQQVEQEKSQREDMERRWKEREELWKREEKERMEEFERHLKERSDKEIRILREAREKAKVDLELQQEEKKRQEEMLRQQREEEFQRQLKEQEEKLARQAEEMERRQQEQEADLHRQHQEKMAQIERQNVQQQQQFDELQNEFHTQKEERRKLFESRRAQLVPSSLIPSNSTSTGTSTSNSLGSREGIIESKDIELVESIGRGAFGEVYRGKLFGKEVAVKKLFNQQNIGEDVLRDFEQEVSIMSKLRHPNILLFLGACTEPGNLMIFTELMDMGSLQDLLFGNKGVNLTFNRRIRILKEIALGMNWLHSLKPPFFHRDLKSGNILLDANWNVKISDFGLSTIKCLDENGEMIQGPVGSPFYMAPEILMEKPYDTKSDVYSFSIIMCETLSNEEPYKDEDFQSFDEMVEAVTIDQLRPNIPSWFPPDVVELLKKCWHQEPDKRLSFQEVIKEAHLDNILINYSIRDPLGRDFWKKFYLEKDSALWKDFLQSFCKFLSMEAAVIPPDHLKVFKFLFAEKASTGLEHVSVERFGDVLDWYGRMKQPRDFLDKIIQLFCQPWFHGDSPQDQIDPFLRQQPTGTWLVRQVSLLKDRDHARHFALVVNSASGLQHHPFFQLAEGTFVFNQQQFTNWSALLSSLSPTLGFSLEKPCPGGIFFRLQLMQN